MNRLLQSRFQPPGPISNGVVAQDLIVDVMNETATIYNLTCWDVRPTIIVDQ